MLENVANGDGCQMCFFEFGKIFGYLVIELELVFLYQL